MSATLAGCASKGAVTEVDLCVEIPFSDAPEGACANNIKGTAYLVPADEWASMRPTMVMLRASDWTKIKKDWLKACRMMIRDGEKCEIAVDSVDSSITRLDEAASKILSR